MAAPVCAGAADDEDREQWRRDFGEPIPPKEEPRYGRDRFPIAQA
jgi:hypothetical protein